MGTELKLFIALLSATVSVTIVVCVVGHRPVSMASLANAGLAAATFMAAADLAVWSVRNREFVTNARVFLICVAAVLLVHDAARQLLEGMAVA